MRLIVVIMITCFMQVSASTFAQRITLSEKNASLETVLNKIKSQTGFEILYADYLMNNSKKVSVDVHDLALDDALNKIFAEQPLVYELKEKTIVIIKKEPTFLERVVATLAHIDIRGRVTDENSRALHGAIIRVKGTNRSTSANEKGEFFLGNVNDKAVLVIAYVGYESREVAAAKNLGAISLKIADNALEEVTVNKGYYRTSKELNTGNVSVVKAEDIAKQPISDPLEALQGRVPGLFIQQTNGAPGRAITVQLRGKNSLANGNDPLYIVDGIPFNSKPLNSGSFISGGGASTSPLNDINPNDIESIEVLKDADATAIYGSRGANGVILITTKKGKAGKTAVDVNVYTGASKVGHMLDLMNTEEYLAMRKLAFKNDGVSPTDQDFDLNGTYDQKKYTNWQKVLIGGTAKVTDAQASISGGNANTQFRIGGGYRYQSTVYPGDLNYKRGSGILSINHQSENGKFRATASASYLSGNNKLPSNDLTKLIFLAPNSPDVYNSDGTLNWANSTWINPLQQSLQPHIENTNNLTTSMVLNYKILEGLYIRSSFAYNEEQMQQSITIPFSSLDPNPNFYGDPAFAREHDRATNNIKTWIIEPQLNYNRKLYKGILDVSLGTTFQQTKQEGISQTANGFSSDDLIGNFAAGTLQSTLTNPQTQYRYNAGYARIGYNFLDKYVLNLTGRRDGSSRFGPGKQFGNFGAIGAVWIFSKEDFVSSNLRFLSSGKLRASIGTTGNDKLLDYKYLSTYSSYSFSYQGVSGLYPTQLTNPFYSWEKVKKIEAAAELGFIQDRILFNISWYRNRTDNQLVGYTLPGVAGFTTIQANLPAVLENKGLEVELNSINIKNKSFSWTTSFNVSAPHSELISYPNLKGSGYASQYAIGQPLFLLYRYVYTGIDPTTGLYTFKDFNKDGKISASNDRAFIFRGQNYFGGLSNSFKYKNLQLDFMLVFVRQKGENFIFNTQPGGYAGGYGNQPKSIVGNKELQPYTQDYGSDIFNQNQLFDNSDARIADVSYIRLRNVALTWMIPDLWKKKSVLKGGKVFLQVQNLLTLTNYKGLDPETLSIGSLPPLRMIVAGMQINL